MSAKDRPASNLDSSLISSIAADADEEDALNSFAADGSFLSPPATPLILAGNEGQGEALTNDISGYAEGDNAVYDPTVTHQWSNGDDQYVPHVEEEYSNVGETGVHESYESYYGEDTTMNSGGSEEYYGDSTVDEDRQYSSAEYEEYYNSLKVDSSAAATYYYGDVNGGQEVDATAGTEGGLSVDDEGGYYGGYENQGDAALSTPSAPVKYVRFNETNEYAEDREDVTVDGEDVFFNEGGYATNVAADITDDTTLMDEVHYHIEQPTEAIQDLLEGRAKLDRALDRYYKQEGKGLHVTAPSLVADGSALSNIIDVLKSALSVAEYLESLHVFCFPFQNISQDFLRANTRKALTIANSWLHTTEKPSVVKQYLTRGYQDKKDTERDTFILNETVLSGAEGYEAVVSKVAEELRRLQPSLTDQGIEEAAKLVIHTGARTQSAGDSFDAVFRLLSNPELVMISPDSTAAEPICIKMSTGQYAGGWGLGANVTATTVYKLVDVINPEMIHARVQATYVTRFLLRQEDADEGIRAAVISLSLLEDSLSGVAPPPSIILPEGDSGRDLDSTASPKDVTFSRPVWNTLQSKLNNSEKPPVRISMYGWGKTEEGVLGVGSTTSRVRGYPSPISFDSILGVARVVSVCAGLYHSAALTSVGFIFTWGSNMDGALGHGDFTNRTTPTLVEYFGFAENGPIPIKSLAIGSDEAGSHTVALTTEGRVYCWGTGSALGCSTMAKEPTPMEVTSGLPSLKSDPIVKVAAGGGFTVVISSRGDVFSWGKWLNGRLGLGPPPKVTNPRNLGRSRIPRWLLSPRRLASLRGVVIVDVACGETHCLAVSDTGNVYAWGGGVFGQLGVGTTTDKMSPVLVPFFGRHILNRNDNIETTRKEREISNTSGSIIFAASVIAGARHSAAIDMNGNMYSWGGLGRYSLGHPEVRRIHKSKTEKVTNLWAAPRLVKGLADSKIVVVQASAGFDHTAAVTSDGELYIWGDNAWGALGNPDKPHDNHPRLILPNTQRGMAHQRVDLVCCGGYHTLAVTSGSVLACDFRKLFEETCMNVNGSQFADIILVVEGRLIYAHKLILSQRSPKFKEMIRRDDVPGRRLELLLQDIRYEVALKLVEYIYCDNMYGVIDATSSLPGDLLLAATEYEIPRLRSFCQCILASVLPFEVKDEGGIASLRSVLPSSLEAEYEDVIDGDDFADVKFIADGMTLFAHKVILSSRSDYFKAMFGSSMREGLQGVVEISVPDSYETFRRVLLYIYTGFVDINDEQSLVDTLLAADRYSLSYMKSICCNMATVTVDNCCRYLELAELVSAPSLLEEAASKITENLNEVIISADYKSMVQRNSKLLEPVFSRIEEIKTSELKLDGLREEEEEEEVFKDEKDEPIDIWKSIPWKIIILLLAYAIVFFLVLQTDQRVNEYIPYFNISLVAILLFSGLYTVSKE